MFQFSPVAPLGALERFGPKSDSAVPFIQYQLRQLGKNPLLPLRTGMMRVLAAIGPAAKDALPEVESQLAFRGLPAAKDRQESETLYRTLHEAAAKAYKAISGQEPPENTPKKK